METQDELEQRLAEMEDLYAQRDECLDRFVKIMVRIYNYFCGTHGVVKNRL